MKNNEIRRRTRERTPCEDRPADDEQAIVTRLENWAAWLRSRPVRGRALSAEGRYVHEGTINREVRSGPGVDPLDANEINLAMLRIGRAQRTALEMRYFLGAPDRTIARVVAVPARVYGRFMRIARLSVRNAASCIASSRALPSAAQFARAPSVPITPPGPDRAGHSPEDPDFVPPAG